MVSVMVILKRVIDDFLAGRFILGLLAGVKRQTNVFWQLFDVASKPSLWLMRYVSPKLILDLHIPLATVSEDSAFKRPFSFPLAPRT
jgi:hypothetical protein